MPTPPPAIAPLAPELEEYDRQYVKITEEAQVLLRGMTDVQFNWRAAPEQWSVAECLAHLNDVGSIYLRPIDRAIAQGRAEGWTGTGPFRKGVLGTLMIRSMEPPPRFRMKTPRAIRPLPEQPMDAVVPRFTALQEQLRTRVRNADGLDLERLLVTSPLVRLLKLNLAAVFGFLAAHERRHLWQARRVTAAPEYPRS